jgi:diaminopropionate ammonia-lyase
MLETQLDISEAAPPWDKWHPTQLIELPRLARLANVSRIFAKSEGERPLGNFKVLGGMIAGMRAVARIAARAADCPAAKRDSATAERRPRLICASDGNHGLAVAAAAKRAGAMASIYLPMSVSPARARRIEAQGAELIWVRGTYDDAVSDAAAAAEAGKGVLVSDTSPDPNDSGVLDVMAGYGILTRELVAQFPKEEGGRPTHLFVQAGVGGLAAALTEGLHGVLHAPGKILVVEPESAACVAHALAVGQPTPIPGDLHTSAEMLSSGLASAAAVRILKRHDARSVLVSETELRAALEALRAGGGPDTTASGAAGFAGLLHVAARPELRARHQLDSSSVVLLVITEGPLAD